MKLNIVLPAMLVGTGVLSLSASPQSRAANPTPAANVDHVNPETTKCIKAAEDNDRPRVLITVGKVSLAGKFAKITLSIDNLTTSPIWMNLHPDALGGGLPREQQLFVTIHAPQNTAGYGRTYDAVPPPRDDDYGVIAPRGRYQLIAVVDATPLYLRPGRYRVDACFWDRTPTIPNPPQRAVAVRGPVAASDVVVVTFEHSQPPVSETGPVEAQGGRGSGEE